jgi:hypothetical protein
VSGLTFLLAIVGYAGLTITAISTARGRVPAVLWRMTVAIIVVHVALVWAVRFEWSWAQATRNGYLGFVIFHGALAMIVASLWLRDRAAAELIYLSFAIVSAGALGAVFRYDEVAPYRIIVIVLILAGVGGLVHGFLTRRAHG